MSRGHRSKAAACVDADRGKKHMWTLADPKRSETSSKRDVNICPPLSTYLLVWWGSFGLMAIWTHGRSTSKGTRGMSDFTQWPSAPGTPCAYRPADGLCSPKDGKGMGRYLGTNTTTLSHSDHTNFPVSALTPIKAEEQRSSAKNLGAPKNVVLSGSYHIEHGVSSGAGSIHLPRRHHLLNLALLLLK